MRENDFPNASKVCVNGSKVRKASKNCGFLKISLPKSAKQFTVKKDNPQDNFFFLDSQQRPTKYFQILNKDLQNIFKSYAYAFANLQTCEKNKTRIYKGNITKLKIQLIEF